MEGREDRERKEKRKEEGGMEKEGRSDKWEGGREPMTVNLMLISFEKLLFINMYTLIN